MRFIKDFCAGVTVSLFVGLTLLTTLSTGVFAQTFSIPGMQVDEALAPNPDAPLYRQTGEQYRSYDFPGSGESIPYRLFVPESWTPDQSLPILITLRAGPSINNNHRNNNDLVLQARARGYIVISPLGYRGYAQPYYGSPYPVDRPTGPSVPAAGWTAEENSRSEQDVINVLHLVAQEYNADITKIFVHGQNPSASSAFHFAAKYPRAVRGIVASAGPIITANYPFENLVDNVAVLMIHGTNDTANTRDASLRVTRELAAHGIDAFYYDVPGGEHLTAYLTFAAGIFDFLDQY